MFKRTVTIILILLAFLSLSGYGGVLADETSDKYDALQEKIDELTQKLTETRNRATSLSSQVAYMDNQIRLTQLKFQETKTDIVKTTKEVEGLSRKIYVLDGSLTDVSEVLIDRVKETYKTSHVSPGMFLLSSNGFTELVARSKYLHLVQTHDKKLMVEIQQTKSDYENQKELLEKKKEELELLEIQLEEQQLVLDQQKEEKQALLSITKSDEKRYQELLTQAKAEQSAIESAMKQAVFNLKDGTPIEKGQQIALMGNSGAPSCSTGSHLHLEVTKDGIKQNPSSYLSERGVIWDNSPDGTFGFGGDWAWPMDGDIRITQGYGMTYWARTGFYGGSPHWGIDMVSSNVAIKAPKKGTLYKGGFACGSSTLKYVAIEHEDNVISWYFHVQ